MDYLQIYLNRIMEISNRIKKINGSLTTELFEKANQMKNEGKNVISFTAGDLYCNISEVIRDSAIKAINSETNHYTNVAGINDLRKAISERIYRKDYVRVDYENILICNGAKQCINNLLNVILDKDDEIIIFNPSWKAYSEMTRLAGGVPIIIDLEPRYDYRIDFDNLRNKITNKTKAILINSPNNPSGKIIEYDDMKKLIELVIENDILLISDEVYREIVYKKEKFISANSFLNQITQNNIAVIDSISKSNALTGWRIGYMNVPNKFVKYLKMYQSYTTSNANSVAQVVAIDAILNDDEFINNLRNELEEKRNFVYEFLNGIKGLQLGPKPDATFYMWVNIEKIEKDSLLFSKNLLEKANVAVIPGIEFGKDGYIRISFANSFDEIKEGMEKIKKYLL